MSFRHRVGLVTATVVASALMLTGCGSTSLPSVPALFQNAGSTSSQAGIPAASGSGGSSSDGSGSGVFNPDCLGLAGAYATIAFAMLPALTGGTPAAGTYDSASIQKAISSLGTSVPAELKGDFQTLSDAAKATTGKSMTDAATILGTPAVSAASDDISNWVTKNCGG